MKPLKPIGGEIELYQIAEAADLENTPWFLAKAISDYAGLAGPKHLEDNQPPSERKKLAEAAAADFTEFLLTQEGFNECLQ